MTEKAKEKKQKKKMKQAIEAALRKLIHIHLHTIYSQGDAMCKPEVLAKRAVDLGIDTIVVTDHGNISGVIQMKKACKKYGLKLIPGCEMYEADDRLVKGKGGKNEEVEEAFIIGDDEEVEDLASTDSEQDEAKKGYYHITILPMNNEGWSGLQYLIADANSNGFYRKPRTDMNIIEETGIGKNLVATSGCLAGKIPQLILAGKYEEAKKEAIRRSKIFGAFFLEVQDNGSREQDIVNMELIQMSKETGIPLVFAKDVHYVFEDDAKAHHALVAMSRKQTIYECHPYPGTNTYHFAGVDEVYEWAVKNNIPLEAIENTVKIGEMCNVTIETGKNLMPVYPYVEEGHNDLTYLKKLLYDKLIEFVNMKHEKGESLDVKAYIDRIEREYSVIALKNFPSYFLLLWDILGWASDRKKWASIPANAEWLKIPGNEKYMDYPEYTLGPGRGSAAGAMIAFLLDITRLDPIEYGLLFERFLNPYRDSPPDIDVDFPGDNHELMLDFVAQRYGRDKTAQILTFTKYKLRKAIDKGCKALMKKDEKGKIIAYGPMVANEIKKVLEITGDQAKMPDQSDCTYSKMMEISVNPAKYEAYGPTLPKFIDASAQFRILMDKYPELNAILPKVEGCIETSGIHAGGVIISNRPVSMDCPTILPRAGSKAVMPITMWDYPDCEEVGLLKMDLLRTATLRVISFSQMIIKETTGKHIDMYSIGRDDPATFDLIAKGHTHGLFQINSSGITQYTRQVSPKDQYEVIDILALYRPGPLDATLDNGNTIAQQYVLNGKRKPKEYLAEVNKNMRPFVKASRGQMVYQEQIMFIVQEVAGYNLGHADTFRRVIGKKKITEMPKLHDEFVYGHKYVIKKWEKLLAEYDTMPKVYDENGTEMIEVKSSYDGNIVQFTKKELESELSNTKKAMETHEIPGALALGYEKKFAKSLFKQMAAFAGYAFNRSHSACYADETYQTAWLKAHHPIAFMCALLTIRSEGSGSKDKTLDNLKEAKRMGIRILPPNINKSFREFMPDGDGIRFGLLSIAGVGAVAVDQIITERKANGEYKDFNDFVTRMTFKGSSVNRGIYRLLIQAGCFDEFNANRYTLLNHYNFQIRKDKVYDGTLDELAKDKRKSNHSYLYPESGFTEKRALEMERELIGIYVSGSPYDGLPFTSLSDMEVSRRRDKTFYQVGGRITNVKAINTRGGKKMAFIQLETQLEPMEATVFPDAYAECEQHLYKDNIVVLKGYKEKSFYKGEEKEQFICTGILIKKAKKLKKEMGIKEKPLNSEADLPILKAAEAEKPAPKADPVQELLEGKKPKKSKKKGKGIDLSDYDDVEEDWAV